MLFFRRGERQDGAAPPLLAEEGGEEPFLRLLNAMMKRWKERGCSLQRRRRASGGGGAPGGQTTEPRQPAQKLELFGAGHVFQKVLITC